VTRAAGQLGDAIERRAVVADSPNASMARRGRVDGSSPRGPIAGLSANGAAGGAGMASLAVVWHGLMLRLSNENVNGGVVASKHREAGLWLTAEGDP
jgi:hypothetical protein